MFQIIEKRYNSFELVFQSLSWTGKIWINSENVWTSKRNKIREFLVSNKQFWKQRIKIFVKLREESFVFNFLPSRSRAIMLSMFNLSVSATLMPGWYTVEFIRRSRSLQYQKSSKKSEDVSDFRGFFFAIIKSYFTKWPIRNETVEREQVTSHWAPEAQKLKVLKKSKKLSLNVKKYSNGKIQSRIFFLKLLFLTKLLSKR